MEDGKNKGAIQGLLETGFVPIGVLIVDGNESWCFGRRRMCKSILCIASINAMAELGGKSEEETLHGLFDTRRVSRGDRMECRGHAW